MGEVYVKDIISDINSILNSYQGKTIVSSYDNTDQITARPNTALADLTIPPAGLPTGYEADAKEGMDELQRSQARLEAEFEKAKKIASAKLGDNPEHRKKILFSRKQGSKNTARRRRKLIPREEKAFERHIGNQPSFRGTSFDNSTSRTADFAPSASGIKTKKRKRRRTKRRR